MIPIPEELLEQVERGNVLLFIGERIVRDAEGRVVLDQLVAQLAARCEIPVTEDYTFPEIAQVYEDDKGRQALVELIHDQLEASGEEPQLVHRLIAGLTACDVVVTTCFDRRLERAFEGAKRPLHVVIGNLDVVFGGERKARLYKLRGSAERAESLVLTEDDYETLFEDQASISVILQGYLARKTILFVGYDLADPHFKRLYRKVTAPLDDYARRAYAFGEVPPSRTSRWCKRHNIAVVEADATVFLQALTEQLAARAQPALAVPPQLVEGPTAPPPERPYKLLDYYEAKDAAIFFGRQQETQTLSSLIHAHRLVLLYGASGTGKTSLLLAGVVPRLESAEPPYETIYVRALEDPALVIRRTVRRQLPEAGLPENGSLVDFLDTATKALDRTLVIVLDQFEEFFIRLNPQFREAFISELGALYDARDVPVKLVLSLREDWLAAVSEIEERIPEIYRTKMRLRPLTRDQAQQAITAPVKEMGVSYEPALVEQLLDDLTGRESTIVMPPQLQLVCNALYEARGSGERQITMKTYQRLGGAKGVLQQYLADEFSRLGHNERVQARHALEELVTSEGTKAVKDPDELAVALEADVSDLEPVLDKLVRARLLRRLKREDGGFAYELAHEYLIREIGLDPEAQKRKKAEEFIKQQVESWKQFGSLMAADDLARVDEVRDELRLNAEAQELLLRSALQVGHETQYWLGRVRDPERRMAVLTQTAGSKLAVVRQRAAGALGTQDVPETVGLLLQLAVHDTDPSVRTAARESLAKLTEQRPTAVARLRSEIQSADRVTRRAALETLAALPLSGLPAGLRLQVLTTRIRLHTARLVERSLATPWRRGWALALVILLVIGGIAYILSASSYYVDTRPSEISGIQDDVLIVRRGFPLLKLPGLDQEAVNTGIRRSQVARDHKYDVNNERLWGLWVQRSDRAYRKWGQDVVTALELEHRLQVLWYLDQDTGFAALLETAISQNQSSGPSKALDQVVVANPELAPQTAQVLLERLTDDDSEMRSLAARGLGQAGAANPEVAPQVAKALIGLLNDEDAALRYNAVIALTEVGMANPEIVTPQMAETLSGLLTDEESNIRTITAEALARIVAASPEAATLQVAEALIGLLADEDPDTRDNAAKALARVATANPTVTPRVTEALIDLLVDEDPEVRYRALEALAQMETANSETSEILIGLLTGEDSDARYRAAKILGQVAVANPEITLQVTEALIGLLTDEDSAIRSAAAESLARVVAANPEIAPQVTEALIGLLTDESSDVRYLAVEALAQVETANSEIAEALVGLLTDEDPEMRYRALEALARVKTANSEIAEALVGLLTDEDPEMRYRALEALPQVGVANPEIAEALVGLLTDEDPEMRYRALDALGQVEAANAEIVEALVGLLTDEDSDMRYLAVDALGQVGMANAEIAPQVTKALIGLLTDGDSDMLRGAAGSLGQVGAANPETAPQVTDALIELLADRDANVRHSAVQALGQVGVANPKTAPQVTKALTKLLADKHAKVRNSAVEPLGQVGAANPETAPQVTDALIGLLADRDANVRYSAVQALRLMVETNPDAASPQVAEALAGRLNDRHSKVRYSAVSALSQVGVAKPEMITPQMAEGLAKLLTEADSKARAEVAGVLVQVYAHQALHPDEIDELLFAKLIDPLNALERPIAARTLFLIVLDDPARGQAIRSHLETLAVSPEPIARIWANTTLQMIDLASLAHAAIEDPSQQKATEGKLNKLRRGSFLGEDFTWAAHEALNWLKQQTTEAEDNESGAKP